jgi:hypothetical protein
MNKKQILFAADNHYGTHGGKVLFEKIKDNFDIDFYEDNWSCFSHDNLADRYDLIILNMISGTCDIHSPSILDIKNILTYIQIGMPLFLLHGSSAALWQLSWWREIVGYRWVKDVDPDGVAPSVHPICPYKLRVAKSRHSLCEKLKAIDLPKDELYTDLEQTCPAITIMEAVTEKGIFPMCYEATTLWGGSIITYIPGHDPEVIRIPENIDNCKAIIKWLLR